MRRCLPDEDPLYDYDDDREPAEPDWDAVADDLEYRKQQRMERKIEENEP